MADAGGAAPLVSVVMPVYNAGAALERTLNALRSQTHEACQFVCVDDGSTDGSRQRLEAAAAQDPRFRVIGQENAGAYAARALGISQTEGAYVAFCDAGDLPAPEFLETLLARARETGADMAVGAYRRAELGRADTAQPEMTAFGTEDRKVAPDAGWLVTVNTALWNKLYRRELLDHVPDLERPPRVSEDALFLLALYPHVSSVAFTDEVVYDYVLDPGSAMQSVSPEDFSEAADAWTEVRAQVAEEAPAFLPLFDLAAFVHLGVSLPTRLDAQGARELPYRDIKARIDRDFPLQRRSALLGTGASKSQKLGMTALAHGLYATGLMAPAMGAYRLLDRLGVQGLKW